MIQILIHQDQSVHSSPLFAVPVMERCLSHHVVLGNSPVKMCTFPVASLAKLDFKPVQFYYLSNLRILFSLLPDLLRSRNFVVVAAIFKENKSKETAESWDFQTLVFRLFRDCVLLLKVYNFVCH